jgi:hypothetical protein
MADTLAAKMCTPCEGGIPPLTPQQAEGFHRQVPGWELQTARMGLSANSSSRTSAKRSASFSASASLPTRIASQSGMSSCQLPQIFLSQLCRKALEHRANEFFDRPLPRLPMVSL